MATTMLDLLAQGWDPMSAQQAMQRVDDPETGCLHGDDGVVAADELDELDEEP